MYKRKTKDMLIIYGKILEGPAKRLILRIPFPKRDIKKEL